MIRLLIPSIFTVFLIPHLTFASVTAGDLVKCEDFSTVYYLAEDDVRNVFPNEGTFFSWYDDFDDVKNISCDDLASISLGGNVTYKPGVRMLKLVSSPTVYTVEEGGVLREIQSEAQAEALYGEDWASEIDDLPDAFWSSYVLGDPLTDDEVDALADEAQLTSDFTPPTGASAGSGSGNYGPWNTRLMLASSSDGLSWTHLDEVVTDQADVPDLVVDDQGWVYLYYTAWTENSTVVAISTDDAESWVYKYVNLEGFDGMSSAVDPDVQILEDGTFRLYITSDPHDDDGPRTYYAEGTDGISFENMGVAFARAGDRVLDPSTILIGDTWHYFAGGAGSKDGGENWHATSSDGEEFTYDEAKSFFYGDDPYMMSNGIAFDDTYRFYAFNNTKGNIASFYTSDGETWTADEGVRLEVDSSSEYENDFVKDAAVVELPDGTYLMAYITYIGE